MTRDEKLNRKAIEYSLAIKDFMVMHGAKEKSAKTIAKMVQFALYGRRSRSRYKPYKKIEYDRQSTKNP